MKDQENNMLPNGFRGYAKLLCQIKQRVLLAQQRAIYAANEENGAPAIAKSVISQLNKCNFTLPIKHLSRTHNLILLQQEFLIS